MALEGSEGFGKGSPWVALEGSEGFGKGSPWVVLEGSKGFGKGLEGSGKFWGFLE